MVRQHHQLNGHESEQYLGDSGGQRRLACYSAWGHKELDMTQQMNNHTEITEINLNNGASHFYKEQFKTVQTKTIPRQLQMHKILNDRKILFYKYVNSLQNDLQMQHNFNEIARGGFKELVCKKIQ